MAASNYQPAVCKVIPHGTSLDGGATLHLRLAFTARGLDPISAGYNEFWWDWPTRLYDGWHAGRLVLTWQPYATPLPAPVKSLVLDPTSARVTAPPAIRPGPVQDNSLSWLAGPVTPAPGAPKLTEVWRALIAKANATPRLNLFGSAPATPPAVTPSTCSPNAAQAHGIISRALSARAALVASAGTSWAAETQGAVAIALASHTPYLIHRHDERTGQIMVANLCARTEPQCDLRARLRTLLYQAFAGGAATVSTARRVERNLARLCQSGQPFRDLTCSALLTAFAPLRNGDTTCPGCKQLVGPKATPARESVDWINSAIYRGAAQTAATRAHGEKVAGVGKSARTAWQQADAVPAAGAADIDIAQVTTLANDRPLAEMFGLVLDVQVTQTAVEAAFGAGSFALLSQHPSALRCGFVPAPSNGKGPVIFESYSPVTVASAGAFPDGGNPTRPKLVSNGYLRIRDSAQFTAIDFSYASLQANYRLWFPTMASHLQRVDAAGGELAGLAAHALPRQRRSVERRYRQALEETPPVPEVIDGVVELYYAAAGSRLAERMTKESGQQQATDDGASVRLYADDLLKGYGLEVFVDGNWVSQTYAAEFRAVAVDTQWFTVLDGTVELEGFSQWAPHTRVDAAGDPATTPPQDVHAPENLLTWTGFGLRVTPPGTVRDSQTATSEVQHRALRTSRTMPQHHRFSRLRFSTRPMLRVPLFDLTGARFGVNPALPYDADVELQVPVNRHRRVKAPELLIVQPRQGADSLGDTLDQLIVRTGKERNDDVSQRVLVPPRVAEDLAYLEGKFDTQTGGRRLRDSGSFKDVRLVPRTSNPGQVTVGRTETVANAQYVSFQFPVTAGKDLPLKCPLYADPGSVPPGAYWPDPRASLVYLCIRDLIDLHAKVIRLVIPFYGKSHWPEAHRIYLTAQRISGESLTVSHGTRDGRDEIRIGLPRAYQVAVDLQSLPDGTQFDGVNPPTMPAQGLFMAQAAASLEPARILEAAAPIHTLTLIHAVDAPLSLPTVSSIQFRQIVPAYAAGVPVPVNKQAAMTELSIVFKGKVSLDCKSTGKVTLVAQWDELLLAAGRLEKQHFEAPLVTLDTNHPDQLNSTSLLVPEAAESDTPLLDDWVLNDQSHLVSFHRRSPRASSVRIVARAAMRDAFASYFPGGKGAVIKEGPALSSTWLNSRRPAPPTLKHAMHSFNRYHGDARGARRISGRSQEWARTEAGLCLYVDQPLQDAGEYGLLGVVLWQQPRSQAQSYGLSRRSQALSSDSVSSFSGMNFSPDYPVKVSGGPYQVPGAVRTLDKAYWNEERVRGLVTRWAGDVFQDYPQVASPAPTLDNFVLLGNDPHECIDAYTGAKKPYAVKVFDYLSVGGLEGFETDASVLPPSIHLNDTDPASLPLYPFTILGYEPQYDADKGLYFYEVRFRDFAPETFLKLALVSLQPQSLRFAECSEVVFAPYIKPMGDRFTVVTPDWTGREYQIEVYGSSSERSLIDNHGAFRVELYAKDRSGRASNMTPQGSNPRVTLDLLDAASRPAGCLWSARLKVPADDLRNLRLVVKESRRYAQPGSQWPEPGIGEVMVYWEQFYYRT